MKDRWHQNQEQTEQTCRRSENGRAQDPALGAIHGEGLAGSCLSVPGGCRMQDGAARAITVTFDFQKSERGAYWTIGVPVIYSLDGTKNHPTPCNCLVSILSLYIARHFSGHSAGNRDTWQLNQVG